MIRSKTDLEDGIQIQPSLPASPELSPRSCSPVNEEISDEKAIRAPPVPVTPTVPSEEVPDIPDGGWRAWVVVFGAFLAFFSSFGVIYSYVSLDCPCTSLSSERPVFM